MADQERPQYNHDPTRGETRYPPEEGSQRSGEPGQRDVHSPLNTPVSEIEERADQDRVGLGGPRPDIQGMGRAQSGDADREAGDPSLRGDEDPETRNPAQNVPRGVLDAEEHAIRDAEDATGVDLDAPPPRTSAVTPGDDPPAT